MITATVRKSTVTVAPPATPQPATSATTVEAQVVEVEGVKVECVNTATPAAEQGLENTLLADHTGALQQPVQADAQEPSQAVATRPQNTAVSRPASQYHVDGVEGEWGADDLRFPQLKLVQGSGEMSKMFDNGTIVYADEQLLPPPSVVPGAKNTAIRFVPVTLTKQFREKLSQEDAQAGEMPRVVNSLQEVEDLGGTTRWVDDQRPGNFWEPSSRCIFLLEKPENSDHPAFALELDGKSYGVAVYYAAGGAFRSSAKVIFNTSLTSLLVPVLDDAGQVLKNPRGQVIKRPMLWKNVWTLNFAKVQAGNFNPWRPVVKLLSKEETGPEVRGYCEQLVSTSGEAVAAE
jgi:hypothetical protein